MFDKEKTHDNEIECPHCGYTFDGCEYIEPGDDILECEECDMNFSLTVEYSKTLTTRPIICDRREPKEEHDFPEYGPTIKSTNRDGYFRCRECKKCGIFDFINTDINGRSA